MVNIAQVSEATRPEAGARIKTYAVLVTTTLISLLVGYFFNQGFLVAAFVGLFFFFSIYILQTLVISRKLFLVAGAAVNAIAFAIPFFMLISLPFLAALAALFILLMSAGYRGRYAMKNIMKVRLSRVTHIALGPLTAAFVVFLVTMLILSSGFSVSRERVDRTLEIAVAPFARRYVPDFSPEMEMRTLLRNFAARDVVADDEFQTLPQSVRERLIDQAASQLQMRFEKFLGTRVDLDATVGENAHEIVESKLDSLTPPAKIYWSITAIALVWISVKGLALVVYAPLAVLTFLIYELLLALKFVRVEFESRSKEIVTLE